MSEEVGRRSAAAVAYEALNLAREVKRDQLGHEDLCAERYGNIHKEMAEIKGILKWAGGALFSVIIGLLGFLAAAQFNANDQARKVAESKIDLLERQLHQQAPAARAPSSQP